MTTPALVFMLVMVALVFLLPRRWAFLPLVLSGCYMTVGQRFFVLSLDFTLFRIILLSGWIRLLIRQEVEPFRFHALDRLIILWAAVTIITGTILSGYHSGFIHRLGVTYNALGLYFFFRIIFRSIEDYQRLITALAVAMLPLALAMAHEKLTGMNVFSLFGGVPEDSIIRGEQLRCQGPFAHPILAGSFGVVMLPMVAAVWHRGGLYRGLAVMAIASSIIVIFTPASSGPLVTLVAVVVAMALWPLRRCMKLVRWSLVALAVVLEITMTSHIWYLPGRISNVIGGTGWHRAELMDSAIRHVDQWWLTGSTDTAAWIRYGVSNHPGSADITNYFIFEGVSGGLPRLALFLGLIALAFRGVGRGRALFDQVPPHAGEPMVWALGVSLVAHVVTFMSVYYFDQMVIFWNLTLALCAAQLDAPAELAAVEEEARVDQDAEWRQPLLPGLEVGVST